MKTARQWKIEAAACLKRAQELRQIAKKAAKDDFKRSLEMAAHEYALGITSIRLRRQQVELSRSSSRAR